jgi:hypothetical protein
MTSPQCNLPDPQAVTADPAWDEAFLRVGSYLRAHGLESLVLLNQITTEIIQEVRSRACGGWAGEPVVLSMELTHERIGNWYARTGQDVDWTNERMRAQGRLALVNADLPGRWPNYFLSSDPVPADLAGAIASFQLLPAPELYVSKMTPAPLDFGFQEPDDPRFPVEKTWPPVRTIASWLLIFGFFGVAWAASH